MTHKDYVYWYNGCDEDITDDFDLKSFSPNSLLSFELENMGFPGEWNEELLKIPTGYYIIEYNSYTDSEYSDGYHLYDYEIAAEIVSITPSFKARIQEFIIKKVLPVEQFINDLFKPHWGIDIEYGGAGVGRSNMYLPKALYYRFLIPKHYAHNTGWGKEYTKIGLRRH